MAKTVVITPLVIVKDPEGHDVYLYHGAEVPSYVDSDRVAQLKSEGYLGSQSDLAEEEASPIANVVLGDKSGDVGVDDSGSGSGPADTSSLAKSADKAAHVEFATSSDRGDAAMSADEADAATIADIRERFNLPG